MGVGGVGGEGGIFCVIKCDIKYIYAYKLRKYCYDTLASRGTTQLRSQNLSSKPSRVSWHTVWLGVPLVRDTFT